MPAEARSAPRGVPVVAASLPSAKSPLARLTRGGGAPPWRTRRVSGSKRRWGEEHGPRVIREERISHRILECSLPTEMNLVHDLWGPVLLVAPRWPLSREQSNQGLHTGVLVFGLRTFPGQQFRFALCDLERRPNGLCAEPQLCQSDPVTRRT